MKNEIPVQSFDSGRVMSRQQVWKVIALTLFFCGWQLSGARGVTFTPFVDLTNSVYIQPQAINPAGVVTGWYYFADFRFHHGFVRALDGTITTFDLGSDTQPQAINQAGTITGFYTDQFGSIQGFVRAPNGNVTTLKFSSNVQAFGITPAGATTGTYLNSGIFSGFILRPGATLPTSFDVPSQGTPVTVTAANGINPAGAVTGYYNDSSGQHGFLRTQGGSFIVFDPQGSGVVTGVSFPVAINSAGAITGWYQDVNVNIHGFIRASNGN
jgi:hypothetical protein